MGRVLYLNFSHQGRVSVHAVIMAVSADHGAVQANIAGLECGHNLNFSGDKITLGNAVHLVQQTENAQLDAVFGISVRNGQGAKHDIQVFGGDGIGQLFLVLFAAQMGQQVSDGKDGVLVVFTDGNGYGGAVLTADNTMQRQRDGRPLILADTAVIVGAEVSQAILFKQRHRAQVQARGINMGNVQMEALGHAALADGSCQHALAAIDQADFIPCVQCHAGHKGLVASLLEQLLAISGGFALGFGSVQESLVTFAESIGFCNGIRLLVSDCFVFIQQFFQFLCCFHDGILSSYKFGQGYQPELSAVPYISLYCAYASVTFCT